MCSYWWFVCNFSSGLSAQCACFSCDVCVCPAHDCLLAYRTYLLTFHMRLHLAKTNPCPVLDSDGYGRRKVNGGGRGEGSYSLP